jgi:type IV pilus assembly protein PilV
MTRRIQKGLDGRQRGLTLLELLVALTVLTIGSLGLLSLARVSTGYQQASIFRLRAVAAADDLAGRVRANRAGLAAYAGSASAADCASGDMPAAACDPATLAADDLADWRARHLAGLPGGAVSIDYLSDAEPPALQVALRWRSPSREYFLSRRLTP